jgi:Mn2+/Fe2+ NRAMP family transporter
VTVSIPWHEALRGSVVPTWQNSSDIISLVAAVLGTTISPYLYFWQSSQEAKDQREQPRREKLTEAPKQAPAAYERIRLDTWSAMALSNVVALAIMLTAAATLHVAGKTDIDSSPAAYAIGEALRWPVGLARSPKEARALYATLAVATAGGTVLNFLSFDPIRALYWSAVINGVMVAPIIVVMMKLATNRRVMTQFTLSPWLRVVGLIATWII